MAKNESVMQYGPVVCAIGKCYSIMIPVKKKVLMSVVVGGKEYFNHSNGIRRSDCIVQCFEVPCDELDRAGEYTVKYEEIILRLPYSCTKKAEKIFTFKFKPVTKTEKINIYHIADTHGMKTPAIKAGEYFGNDLDLLILNGDISSSCNSVSEIMLSYKIAYEITKGEIPCVITRGNHDLRGKMSEKLEEMLPTQNRRSYYSVRLGCMWFLVLDCGEDKEDSHGEYSGTASFHQIRLDETEFIEKIIENSSDEYENDGVKYRFIISHIPITFRNKSEKRGENPFDIENEIYDNWTALLAENIHPQLMICGHLHESTVFRKGSGQDHRNSPCDVLIGSTPIKEDNNFIGAAITVESDRITAVHSDKNHKEISRDIININS